MFTVINLPNVLSFYRGFYEKNRSCRGNPGPSPPPHKKQISNCAVMILVVETQGSSDISAKQSDGWSGSLIMKFHLYFWARIQLYLFQEKEHENTTDTNEWSRFLQKMKVEKFKCALFIQNISIHFKNISNLSRQKKERTCWTLPSRMTFRSTGLGLARAPSPAQPAILFSHRR